MTVGVDVIVGEADELGVRERVFDGGCIGRTVVDLFEETFNGSHRIPLGLHLVFVGTEVFGGDVYVSGVEMGDEGAGANEGKAMGLIFQ